MIPLTRFGNFHFQVWCFFKRASEYVAYSVTLQSSDFLTRDKISYFFLFFFNISFIIGFDLGWKDGRDAHIDDHPVADNEDFPVFPQLRAIWLPKQCNVTAGSTSWLTSKFFPTIWGQQVWEPIQFQGNLRSRAHFKSFLDALIASAPSLQWSVMGTDILPCLCNWT